MLLSCFNPVFPCDFQRNVKKHRKPNKIPPHQGSAKKLFKDPLIEGVRWIERYGSTIDKFWSTLPEYIRNSLATMAIFLMASSIKGIYCVQKSKILQKIQLII